LGWAGLFDADLLAVDGGYCALPASECFLQLEIDLQVDVVSVAGEEGMLLL
jgi:hypothetical protein